VSGVAADSSAPTVPGDFEQVVLTHGPSTLRWLVQEAGGTVRASETSKVAVQTMSRWLTRDPGPIFGAPHGAGSYRSIWHGYPSPFPALDRMVEELIDPQNSFIGVLVDRDGWEGAYKIMFDEQPFGLEILGLSALEFREACEAVGVPRTTASRLWDGCRYPKQLEAIDRLALSVCSQRWFILLLSHTSHPDRLPIPLGALQCLVSEIRQGTLKPSGSSS